MTKRLRAFYIWPISGQHMYLFFRYCGMSNCYQEIASISTCVSKDATLEHRSRPQPEVLISLLVRCFHLIAGCWMLDRKAVSLHRLTLFRCRRTGAHSMNLIC